jgi:alpha-tubulin suppressor-like RCC1 family protein
MSEQQRAWENRVEQLFTELCRHCSGALSNVYLCSQLLSFGRTQQPKLINCKNETEGKSKTVQEQSPPHLVQ